MSTNRSVSFGGEVTTAIEVSSATGLYSSESFTLLMNQDPEVMPSDMNGLAQELKAFEARILGRAHDLEGEFDDAATQFTEVIKWDISSLNSEDLAAWMEVTSSIRFCAAITEEWADCVKEYKQERMRIINRWNSEAPGLAQGLDEAPSSFSLIWEESPAEEAEAALAALKTELQGQEETAHSTLDTRGDELSGDLSNGPTPESVQRLIDGGYITWSYFNLGGDVEAMPIDADPEEMADDVIEYLDDPEGYEGDIETVIVLLNNMSVVAMDRQENGGTLTSEELNFLRDFYDALEEDGTSMEYPGVLGVAARINDNPKISHGTEEGLLGALGNGILIISDESLIGEYSNLPESIRNVVEGPNGEENYDLHDWYPQISVFSSMMDNTNPDLSGGEQFSVNLTQTVASHLNSWNLDPDDPNDFRHEALMSMEEAQALIEVSSRNEDANHAILTGEGQYEHPVHGLDAEMTLRALYTQDWLDGGAAVAGMTDWIWEQSDGELHEQERAGEAMAAFMDLFGEPDFMNAISGTGHAVDAQIIDENGKTVDIQWKDASAALLNPQLAWGWSDLFSTYIDSFASEYAAPVGPQSGPEEGNYWDPDLGLMILPEGRSNFLQQIMGNSDAASRVYTDTLLYGQEALNEFVSGAEGEGYFNENSVANAGVLRGLVDSALESESTVRETNDETASEYQNRVRGSAIDMMGAVLSEIPVPGSATVAEGFKIFSKEEFNVDSYQADPMIDNEVDVWEIEDAAQILVIREVASQDPQVLEMLREGCPGLVNEKGEVPVSINNWDVDIDAYNSTLRDAWNIVEQHGSLPGGKTPTEAVDRYSDTYTEAREKVNR